MPPKKGAAAKANAKAKATPKKSTAAAPEPPATVTTNRGKEHDTTAAAARPRRNIANTDATPASSKPKVNAAVEPKKRGRPSRAEERAEEPPKKRARTAAARQEAVGGEAEEDHVPEPPKRKGRPAATKADPPAADTTTASTKRGRLTKAVKQDAVKGGEKNVNGAATTTTSRRGRTAKDAQNEDEGTVAEEPAQPKKRGRSAKAPVPEPDEDTHEDEPEEVQLAKKRGRNAAPAAEPETAKAPAKRGRSVKARGAPAVTEEEQAPPKRRGRPPRGGETTKIDTDDHAAAEQLGEELEDAAHAPKNGKGPAKKGKGGAKPKAAADQQTANHAAVETVGKQYWLMKAEQEDREQKARDGTLVNTKFTIDNLRGKNKPELWDGVRNPQAAKNLRAMRKGDLAFFYASGGQKGRKPSIVGFMEIVSESEPDVTAESESSIYYEGQKGKRRNWVVVGVEFRHKLATPIPLSDLQKYKGAGGVLSKMELHTQARLSVSRVSAAEWKFITEKLIKDEYPGDDALTKGLTLTGDTEMFDVQGDVDVDGAVAAAADEKHGERREKVSELPTIRAEGLALGGDPAELPNHSTQPELPDLPLPTIETDALTTDTVLPSTTNITSRPPSRVGSRALTAKPASRANSRQPSSQPSAARSAAASTAGLVTKTSKAGSRASSRARSAAPSESAILNNTNEISSANGDTNSLRPGSVGGLSASSTRPGSANGLAASSARPGSAGSRASSRGHSAKPTPARAGSTQPAGRMAAVIEDDDGVRVPDELPYLPTEADTAFDLSVDVVRAERIVE